MRNITCAVVSVVIVSAIAAKAQTAPPEPPTTQPARSAVETNALHKQVEMAIDRMGGEWVQQAIKHLEAQREQMLLDEAGAQGRKRGIEEAIAKYTDMTRSRAAFDPVVTELEKIIPIREKDLQRLQQLQRTGSISPSELTGAEAALASARVDLAAAKQRAAGGTASGEALDAWTREAINLSVEAEDRHARLRYIATRLDKLNQLAADLNDLNGVAVDLINEASTEAGLAKNPNFFPSDAARTLKTKPTADVQRDLKHIEADYSALVE